MIDFEKIVARIQDRIKELGTTAAEVSAAATDSKDTIRNWIRAIEADPAKASATIIKINQVEKALGIELARNVTDSPQTAEERLRSALLAYGIHEKLIDAAMLALQGFKADSQAAGPQQRDRDPAQAEPANLPRDAKPEDRPVRQPAS